MSVKTIEYLNNLVQNTDRGPSIALWGDFQKDRILENPAKGMFFFDDFLVLGSNPSASGGAVAGSNGQWATYLYQGATVTDAALEGGVITLQSDGDNEGVAFSGAAGAFRITTTSTLALNQDLWFEARVADSTITATKHESFVGLFDGFLSSGLPQAAWPIQTTDNTLAAAMNCIGFHKKGNAPTDWSFVYQLNGVSAVYPTNLTTLATTVLGAALTAGQSIKLGFRFSPSALPKRISSASTGQTVGVVARPLITVYVNGLPAAAFLTNTNVQGTSFPTGFMAPGFAIMNQTASTPGSLNVDWIGCGQYANS